MSKLHKLLGKLNEKAILCRPPKMDNSNYTEALDFLTGRELSKLKKDALAEYQDLERQLEEAREDVKTYKSDFKTLLDVVIECAGAMSANNCHKLIKQVAEHYEQLKEKGDE